MQVIYAREPFPTSCTRSLFLAGPTPRRADVASWRPEALRLLEALGYDGTVFVPEDRGITGCAVDPESYQDQVTWEDQALARADVILFWVPRDLSPDADGNPSMPAFTTNVEFGEWMASGKAVLGAPEGAPKTGYLKAKAERHGIPLELSLDRALAVALKLIGPREPREGGEAQVPVTVWRTPIFQRWHAAQKAAGNTLLSARVRWMHRDATEPERALFWALEVGMRVGAEGRTVSGSVVVGWPDVSAVVVFGPDRGFSTVVVLVREFRASASTPDGCVHEVPGGSSWKGLAPAGVALSELAEETGLAVPSSSLRPIGERQLLPGTCPHRASVSMVRLTQRQLDALTLHAGVPHVNPGEGERTSIEAFTVRQIVEEAPETKGIDWSTLGMVLLAFYRSA